MEANDHVALPPHTPYRETEDSELFTLIHEVLRANGMLDDDERREAQRAAYQCFQFVAPYDGGTLPEQALFAKVPCHDLSASGFSYLAWEPPSTSRVVVALGRAPFKFFFARVMHHTLLDEGDAPRYVVGCRFVGRLDS